MTAKMTESELIDRLFKVHGSAVLYVGGLTSRHEPATFRCREGHLRRASPRSVLKGHGCKWCKNRDAATCRLTVQEVEDRLQRVNGGAIKLVSGYSSSKRRAIFRCDKGHEFATIAHSVLMGNGCRRCADIKRSKLHTKPIEFIHAEIKKTHGDRVRLVSGYRARHRDAQFECAAGHTWTTNVHNVITGGNCPECAQTGFKPDRPAVLYYIEIPLDGAGYVYKIGITNLTIRERYKYKCDRAKMKCIALWRFKKGVRAAELERKIISKFAPYRYEGTSPLKSVGTTEMFTVDVLGLAL